MFQPFDGPDQLDIYGGLPQVFPFRRIFLD